MQVNIIKNYSYRFACENKESPRIACKNKKATGVACGFVISKRLHARHFRLRMRVAASQKHSRVCDLVHASKFRWFCAMRQNVFSLRYLL